MLYKILVDEVEIDEVKFVKDQLIELEADALNVAELLAEGSIIETSEDAELENSPSPSPSPSPAPADEPVRYFDGKKLSGEVTEVETDGVIYKHFSTEDGATFKLTEEEFTLKVGAKGL